MYALAETLVRLVEYTKKNQDVKSRRMAGLIQKNAHFQIENQLVLFHLIKLFRMGTNSKERYGY